jgi:dienelactone hydrolase
MLHLGRLLLLLFLVLSGCHASRSEDPEHFTSQTHRLTLADKDVAVDFYIPAHAKQAPVVIMAHGFTGSRENMAGWGEHLAASGFLVIIPDMPYFSDHAKNADAMFELTAMVHDQKIPKLTADPDRIALVGFSAGGVETLLAAIRSKSVTCWVGLDPVDYDNMGQKAAPNRAFPALMLRAEPSKCNQHGNARDWPKYLKGPAKVIQIPNSTHCDIEDPAAHICRVACGQRDPDRHHLFVAYTLKFLRENLR